jgi:hypothetical protein
MNNCLTFGVTGLVLGLAGLTSTARAESPPSALVFAPHSGDAKQDARVERAIRAELDALDAVELLPAPALDFEATQLAVDCVGTSERCLSTMAERGKADMLVVASIERAAGQVELRIFRFDADEGGEPRSVRREAEGKKVGAELLDAVPAMVRELFEKNDEADETLAAEAEDEPEEDAFDEAPAQVEPTYRDDELPLGPLLLGAGGAAVIAAGLTVGLVMNGTQSEYDEQRIETPADVDVAQSKRDLGEKQALIANALLGAGAAMLVAGGVWFALELSDDGADEGTAIMPVVGPDAAGVVVRTRWQGLP